MNLEWYYTFLVVAKYQNYRKAAEELFITQTSVYNHIKNLESLLGVALVEQSGRNIVLTDTGRYFCPIAQKTIEVYEQGIYDMKNMKSNYKTTLKIVVTTYIDNYLLPRFLPLFFEKEPAINISTTILEDSIPQAIAEGQYDIGIDRKIPNTKKIHFKNICEGKIQLTVPDIPENRILSSEKEYFEKYRILSDNHPTYWEELKESISKISPDSNFVSISSVRSTADLIKANQGISYLPVYIMEGLKQSKMKLVEPKDILPPISYTYLIWKKDLPAIHTFNTLFEDFIAKEREKIN
ncbi:LysR family transcriptional regulator [Anaerosporobacter sp.]|uniref:LysR family transcriptional regulator n=1 Tax=Anaerosporobacter sp. TaxID=1872529 RepID=UPI00286F5B83|nr:LysR family transcriptional regulator [Anaerosporobacter sp.]